MKFGIKDKVFTRPTLLNFTLTDTIELRYFEKWQHCEKKINCFIHFKNHHLHAGFSNST
tara:strand:- start:234 stop:410 length:177 start_codon:yes stop_codon:yes gene_type:complete